MKRSLILAGMFFLISIRSFAAVGIPDDFFVLTTDKNFRHKLFNFDRAGDDFRFNYHFQSLLVFNEFSILSVPGHMPVLMICDKTVRRVYRHDGKVGFYLPFSSVAAMGQFAGSRAIVLLDDESLHLTDSTGASIEVSPPGALRLKGKARAIAGVSDTHVTIATEERILYVRLGVAGRALVEADLDLTGLGKTDPVMEEFHAVRAGKNGAWLLTGDRNKKEWAFVYFPYASRNVKTHRWFRGAKQGYTMVSIDENTEALIARFDTHLVSFDPHTMKHTTIYTSAFSEPRLAALSPEFSPVGISRFSHSYLSSLSHSPANSAAALTPVVPAVDALADFLALFPGATQYEAAVFCRLANQNDSLTARLKNLSADVLAQYGLSFRGYYLDPLSGAGRVDIRSLGQAVIDAESSCPSKTKAAGAAYGTPLF